jgi:Sec-independent protein secretion pathway component TatC
MLSTSVRAVSGGRQLALADSGEAFMLYTRIAAAAAIVVSSPCVVGLWLHFAGGRTAADAVRATILAVILCVLGVAFGWFVGFPLMARSRAAVGSAEAQLAMEVFRLFLIMVASMALAFQIPAISYGLSQHPPDMDPTPAGGEEEAAGNPKA